MALKDSLVLYNSVLRMLEYNEMDGNLTTLANAIDGKLAASSAVVGGGANLVLKCDAFGNVLGGATSSSYHTLVKPGAADTGLVEFGTSGMLIYKVSGWGVNSANTGMKVGRDAVTNRSFSGGGTVNAFGADYAEYLKKCISCAIINKGDVCGIDKDGELTTDFDAAVTFVVKSTDPSYVGGDTWGSEEVVGPRPVEPQRKTVTDPGDTDEQWAAKQAQYQSDLAAWEARLEAERVKYDRIAFAGQVPCNVTGAQPGDYIVPVRTESGGISAAAKAAADITLADYMSAVGRVIAIEPDQRAKIIVKVA